MIDWVKITSSAISDLSYQDKTLYVRFNSGAVYLYFNVQQAVYKDFLQAESKGRYFMSTIRGRYRYQKM